MAEFTRKDKTILAISMGALLLFIAIRFLSSGPAPSSPSGPPSNSSSTPAPIASSADALVISSIPGTSWAMPSFTLDLPDKQLASELDKWATRTRGIQPEKEISTPSLWVVKIQAQGQVSKELEILPRLKQFTRKDPDLRIFDASQEMQSLFRMLVDRWYARAQGEDSPLSPEEKDKLKGIFVEAQN